ncbi:uncharacterized protein LOC134244233 [Saccostrea cucullata]|uniref:uncharacterized protein LOC134244233 n=1 Tax=Saccostrea cuccullata TaxID=36930 RepID=UPI002ED1AC41
MSKMDLTLCTRLMYIGYFLLHYFLVSTSQICGGIGGKTCCSGYVWNKAVNECIPCAKGYFGHDCKFSCPPPTFGVNCESMCDCSVEKCHHVYGCNAKHTTPYTLESTSTLLTSSEVFSSRITHSETSTVTEPSLETTQEESGTQIDAKEEVLLLFFYTSSKFCDEQLQGTTVFGNIKIAEQSICKETH